MYAIRIFPVVYGCGFNLYQEELNTFVYVSKRNKVTK